MKDIFRINILLDFYNMLLTEHQVKILELYASDDFSLSEIAELTNISRQGVYDNIKRAKKQLEEYENKLQLYNKYLLNKEQLLHIESLIEDNKCDEISSVINSIIER